MAVNATNMKTAACSFSFYTGLRNIIFFNRLLVFHFDVQQNLVRLTIDLTSFKFHHLSNELPVKLKKNSNFKTFKMTHRPDQSFRFQERSYSRCSTPMCQPNPVSPSSSEQKNDWSTSNRYISMFTYYIGYISNALCVIIASYSTTFYFLNKLKQITLL